VTQYVRPRSLKEALETRATHPDWMILAGGTDLMVNANHRPAPAGIIDLWRLDELCFIRADRDRISIGAGATWWEVENHAVVINRLSPLAAAAREIGALQIQARGTLGGNVGTSSPVGDSLPALLALDAEIEVGSVRGRRRIAYSEYCTGYRTTQLAADELIIAAHLPLPESTTSMVWRKVGTRRAQSISKVMGAATIHVDGGVVVSARVAFGAIADRPIRLPTIEEAVKGQRIGAQAGEAARVAMRAAIKPIDDVRSTATYRREVAENLVARFFGQRVMIRRVSI
jgi:xanthine dehydrogenase small subunit